MTGTRDERVAQVQGLQEWVRLHRSAIGLRRVEELVDPGAFEATAVLAQLEDRGAPPVLFPRVRDLTGQESPFSLLFNLYGSRISLARALELDTSSWPELLEGYTRRVEGLCEPQPAETVPVQEHRRAGKEADLGFLPWVRHVQMEGGWFFTPIVASRQPGGARYNLSWNRAMHLDGRHIGVHISPRQLWSFHRDAEEHGQDLPVALVLGHHPAFSLAAASMTPMTVDEYHVAGALMGEPLHVAPSISYGEELLIPAHAELLIEGRLLAGRRAVEGPFGEYMRYLGPQKLSHVLEVDAISWRSGALIAEIFASHADHLNAHVAIHANYLQAARAAVPQVTGVAWFEGGGPTTVIVSMRKSSEGQPMRAALAIMAASNIVKQVIVVDDDIDIYDSAKVLWAVSTRVRADEDLVVIRNLQGNLLDPSEAGFGKTSGFVIDATWPLGSTPAPVARVPEDALAAFPLERYTIAEA